MSHLGGGDQVQDAVHHAQTGAEDGDDRQLLTGQLLKGADGDGRLNLHVLQGQVAGSLVTLQGGNFRDDLTELLDAGALITQNAQLMLEQRMVQNMYFLIKHLYDPLLL